MRRELEILIQRAALAEGSGNERRVGAQHSRGKLTARERIELLLDPGSFVEIDRFAADEGPDGTTILGGGVVTGHGHIHSRGVYVFAQDFTVLGGSLARAQAERICKIMDLAGRNGQPIIGLNDSGGARIQAGVEALAGYIDVTLRTAQLSGVVPQISAILGPCAGGAVYAPAITDLVYMVRGISHMLVTGPDVAKSVTHETVSMAELGGSDLHGETTGVAHFVRESEVECFESIRELFRFIPSNNHEEPPLGVGTDSASRREESLLRVVPDNATQAYDMRDVLLQVLDDRYLFEVHRDFAKNVVVGFAHLGGLSVGVVASQPSVYAGALDADASVKAARFVRFCDCFNIPLVTFVDVPGYLPGLEQQRAGIIKHGAKLLYAYAEATVPKLSVIVRKAYGGGYGALSPKNMRTDYCVAWPTAEIAVVGPRAAVELLYRPGLATDGGSAEQIDDLTRKYSEQNSHPYVAASLGLIDDIIDPRDTRLSLIRALGSLRTKRERGPVRKHGNIPL